MDRLLQGDRVLRSGPGTFAACQGLRPPAALTASQTGAPAQVHAHRFPVRLKLRRGSDFEAVFRDGRRSSDSLFTVLYRRSPLDHARLDMTASAKKLRTAVGRNRIRRLGRESFRHANAQLAGLDIVVLVKEPASRASYAAIFASLETHCARLARSMTAA